MNILIISIVIMAVLGGVFALLLFYASRVFHVKTDPRVKKVLNVLPGTNCGACGYAGCPALAEKMVDGKEEVTACIAGGEEVALNVGEILGVEVKGAGTKQAARLHCAGSSSHSQELYMYQGIEDCNISTHLADGFKQCDYGCLGQGSCARACPFFAITMSNDNLPIVDEKKCTACGICVNTCPKSLFELVDVDKHVHIGCSSPHPGKFVNKVCDIGCIGCRRCVKVCPVKAINMKEHLAVIDYEKCVDCGLCATVCPRKVIFDSQAGKRNKMQITSECIGCGICKKVCPVGAISGEKKQLHTINPDTCIACGRCQPKCPKNAIIPLKDIADEDINRSD